MFENRTAVSVHEWVRREVAVYTELVCGICSNGTTSYHFVFQIASRRVLSKPSLCFLFYALDTIRGSSCLPAGQKRVDTAPSNAGGQTPFCCAPTGASSLP